MPTPRAVAARPVRLAALKAPTERVADGGSPLATAGAMQLTFDRGTLLLEALPPDLDPSSLPGVLWDPRVGAYRAPPYRLAELTAALAARGVAAPPPDPTRRRAPPADLWSRIALRPYQDAALLAWELKARRGLVVLPTGSGKTRLALAAAARSGASCLVLVPTRVLLEQWQRQARAFFAGPIGCLGDGRREVEALTVATFESAWRRMPELGDRFDLLVVDEAHHFGRGQRDEALEMSLAGARLGLTATPPTAPGQPARLAELLGPVVYELAVDDLAGRYLAEFDHVTLTLDLTPDERRVYEEEMAAFRRVHRAFRRAAPGAEWSDFVRSAGQSDEGRRALAAWRRARRLLAFTHGKAEALRAVLARHRDARVLVFTADNQTAYAVAREHLIMPITCHVGRAEREEALGAFARGELRALVSARVLNEGLDVPDADVAVIVGGTQGGREHVQRVGRILRPAAGKRARVYELVLRGTSEVWQALRRRAWVGGRGEGAARRAAPL